MAPPDVVVTGAGGTLGGLVVSALGKSGAAVLGLGRGRAPADMAASWATVDLNDGVAIRASLRKHAIVVHAASDPLMPGADARMAAALAQAANEAGVAQIVFVQIAGIGAAARRVSAYYRGKLAAEDILRNGLVPCSTVTVTQFHGLIDRVFRATSFGPALLRPRFNLQPVDPAFAADRVAEIVRARSTADLTICGPEALSSREMAVTWIASRGRSMLNLLVPSVGLLAGLAQVQPVRGLSGGRSWASWLKQKAM